MRYQLFLNSFEKVVKIAPSSYLWRTLYSLIWQLILKSYCHDGGVAFCMVKARMSQNSQLTLETLTVFHCCKQIKMDELLPTQSLSQMFSQIWLSKFI